jgi:hypothetical protein
MRNVKYAWVVIKAVTRNSRQKGPDHSLLRCDLSGVAELEGRRSQTSPISGRQADAV